MSVSIAFIIALMLFFIGYMGYRLYLRRKLSIFIPFCLQVFILTIAIVSFCINVQTNLLIEFSYILFGIIIPGIFFVNDYKSMMKKIREQGVTEKFIERVELPVVESEVDERNNENDNSIVVSGIIEKNSEHTLNESVSELEQDTISAKKVTIKAKDYKKYYNSGTECYHRGQKTEAIEWFKKAIEIKPDSYESYYNMAVALDELGNSEEAVFSFRKVIALKTDLIDAYNNLGIILSTLGRHSEAIDAYNEALSKNPGEYSLYFNMGITLSDAGRYKEAIKAYQRALEFNPEEYEIKYHLGAALTEAKMYNEAIEAYKSALSIKPSDSELYYNLSIVYSLIRKPDIALDNLRRAIDLNNELRREAKSNIAFNNIKNSDDFRRIVS